MHAPQLQKLRTTFYTCRSDANQQNGHSQIRISEFLLNVDGKGKTEGIARNSVIL
jgi:hypothetical protein